MIKEGMTMLRKLLSTLALALVALVAACGGDDDAAATAQFRATWMITQPNGQATTCAAAGVDSVSFLFTDSAQMGYDEIYTCTDMTSVSGPLPLDTFTFIATPLDATDMPVPGIAPVSNTATLTTANTIVPLPAVNLHMQ
jgi:hypothetical protein